MILLIVLRGRPIRSASSACVMPRVSSVSASVSPGGTAKLGSNVVFIFVQCVSTISRIFTLVTRFQSSPPSGFRGVSSWSAKISRRYGCFTSTEICPTRSPVNSWARNVRTLFGDAEPAGRLTVSVPRSVGQVPIYYNHLNTGRPRVDPIGLGATKPDPYFVTGYIDQENTPLYPFGYGLTYTSFSYSPAHVSAATLSSKDINLGKARLAVSAEVRNTGNREGTETAQLYIRLRGTSVARPVRELKGFQRVHLAPGESRRLEFELGRDELAFWNADMKEAAEPGSLYVWVAPDSARGTPAKVELAE